VAALVFITFFSTLDVVVRVHEATMQKCFGEIGNAIGRKILKP